MRGVEHHAVESEGGAQAGFIAAQGGGIGCRRLAQAFVQCRHFLLFLRDAPPHVAERCGGQFDPLRVDGDVRPRGRKGHEIGFSFFLVDPDGAIRFFPCRVVQAHGAGKEVHRVAGVPQSFHAGGVEVAPRAQGRFVFLQPLQFLFQRVALFVGAVEPGHGFAPVGNGGGHAAEGGA